LRGARLWFAFEVPLDLFERRVIVGFGAKRTDHFFRHDTVSGLMRSYSAWVPMNFTSTRSRYELLLFQKTIYLDQVYLHHFSDRHSSWLEESVANARAYQEFERKIQTMLRKVR
jgi:hypothetical protein